MAPDDSEDAARLRYVARVLAAFARRCRDSGVSMPPELEALRLLASGRHAAPDVDEPRSGDECLLWTYEEAARMLRISPRTLTRLIGAGAMPTVRLGGSRRIAVDDLRAFVAALPRGNGG